MGILFFYLPVVMSSATAIPIDPSFAEAFKDHSARYFVVRIVNELLVSEYKHPKGGSLEADWNTIAQKADNRAGYILVQTEPRKWLTITFVPQGTKIRDKMVYAATKATLLNHLGYQFFYDELHANDNNELSYDYFQSSKKPTFALSAYEVEREQVHKEEDRERDFRSSMHTQNQNKGIGGYHSVAMPFDAKAKEMVRNLASGQYNFVELAVNAAKNGITGEKGKNVSIAALGSEVNTMEPRYYLVKNQSRNAFVYCCPPKSPQKLRMVYSTAKGSVMAEAKALGFSVAKAGEISEPSEFNSQYLNELGAPSPSTSYGGSYGANRFGGPTRSSGASPAASRSSVIQGAHPVYSLMGASPNSGRSKKVVLPPPGAY